MYIGVDVSVAASRCYILQTNLIDLTKIVFNMVSKERFLQTAYHEAGHIIFTYLTGYSCDGCELLGNGDGKTSSEYGKDLLLITGIINSQEQPEIFNNLDKNIKAQFPVVAHRIMTIYLAGSVVESAFLNNGIVNGNMEVEISGPDLIRANNIQYLLLQLKKENHDSNYIQKTMTDLFTMISLDEIWKPISELAKKLIEKGKLNKQEIEDVLNQSGFLEYIKTL